MSIKAELEQSVIAINQKLKKQRDLNYEDLQNLLLLSLIEREGKDEE